MTLHIFNPEHDIALASNLSNFTAPHAGRQLRYDLGWLPALWAGKDDAVLVDDITVAQTSFDRFLTIHRLHGRERSVQWCTKKTVGRLAVDRIEPWGWDAALCAQLDRAGLPSDVLPSAGQIEVLRQLSSRLTSHRLLPLLQQPGTIGESFVCRSIDEVAALFERKECLKGWGGRRLVLKAPWSSSGRGLRFLDTERNTLEMQSGWLRHVIGQQGFVMAEPYYNKVKDFAVEFMADADGHVRAVGLSLFHTKNGAYLGNVLATEQAKRRSLCGSVSVDGGFPAVASYLPPSLLDETIQRICRHAETLFDGRYAGPFGVDMMVVAGDGTSSSFLLHPCVELNLRQTMGHVALMLTPLVNPKADDEVKRVMRIELSDHYQLKLQKLTANSCNSV